jgi:mRNA interferase HigB
MHVMSRKKILDFCGTHADAATPLDTWYRVAKRAFWANLNEVRAVYPHADPVGECVVVNIGGPKYRLITHIAYATGGSPRRRRFRGKIYILHILTHREYDDGKWKADCGC